MGVNFKEIDKPRLQKMAEAGDVILECYRVLAKTNANIVGEILANQGTFFEWDHYPEGDVVDWETHGQYYYHAHSKDDRSGEHGHFHTFLRYEGMPEGLEPAPLKVPQKEDEDRVGSHLIAISMNNAGFPIGLFTVNRWVTDETFYPAQDVEKMLDHFEIDHTFPSWAVNKWLTAMVVLFRPQISELIKGRDKAITQWKNKTNVQDVYEDRSLEITSSLKIDVKKQLECVFKASEGI